MLALHRLSMILYLEPYMHLFINKIKAIYAIKSEMLTATEVVERQLPIYFLWGVLRGLWVKEAI